ncbi:hypothetical protein BH10PSE10_BH10PSE10_09720 [soil metagenome]
MRNLPPSLVIALWFTGAVWCFGLVVYEFGVDRHVLYATFLLGFVAAFVEGGTSRSS